MLLGSSGGHSRRLVRSVASVRCPGGSRRPRASYSFTPCHSYCGVNGNNLENRAEEEEKGEFFSPSMCFVDFPSLMDRAESSLCILSSPEMLSVHTPDGTVHEIPLPFEAKTISPLYFNLNMGKKNKGLGLLIQRAPAAEDFLKSEEEDKDDNATNIVNLPISAPGTFFPEDNQGDTDNNNNCNDHLSIIETQEQKQYYSIYLLRHPLEAVRPVALVNHIHSNNSSMSTSMVSPLATPGRSEGKAAVRVGTKNKVSFFRHHEIVFLSDATLTPPLCVTYDPHTKSHHLWTLEMTSSCTSRTENHSIFQHHQNNVKNNNNNIDMNINTCNDNGDDKDENDNDVTFHFVSNLTSCHYNENRVVNKAKHIFLAGEKENTATLHLLLHNSVNAPSSNSASSTKIHRNMNMNTSVLHTFWLSRSGNGDRWKIMERPYNNHFLHNIECKNAQPILSPLGTTDILIFGHYPQTSINNDNVNGAKTMTMMMIPTLSLYRGVHKITDILLDLNSLPLTTEQQQLEPLTPSTADHNGPSHFLLYDIAHPVHDRVDMSYINTQKSCMELYTYRVSISLSLRTLSPLTDMCLFVMERRFNNDNVSKHHSCCGALGAKLRAAVIKTTKLSIEQINGRKEEWNGKEIPDDLAWSAFEMILLRSVEGADDTDSGALQSDKIVMKEDPFGALLLGNYHETYAHSNSHLFHFRSKMMSLPVSHHPVTATSSKWDFSLSSLLLNSEYPLLPVEDQEALFQNLFPTIFDILHLLYENCKLIYTLWLSNRVHPLAKLLLRLSTERKAVDSASVPKYVAHYCRDLGISQNHYDRLMMCRIANSATTLSSYNHPPCFLFWAYGLMIDNHNKSHFSENLNDDPMFKSTQRLRKYYYILFSPNNNGKDSITTTTQKYHNLVLTMANDGLTLQDLESIPVGLAMPLYEALRKCRDVPPNLLLKSEENEKTRIKAADVLFSVGCATTVSGDRPIHHHNHYYVDSNIANMVYRLIGREDLLATMEKASSGSSKGEVEKTSPQARHVAASYSTRKSAFITTGTMEKYHELHQIQDPSGLLHVENFSSMLFGHDRRVHEVCRLLRSSTPVYLKVDRAPEVSDHEHERRKQSKLLLLCGRNMALPLGRGMLTLGTLRPLLSEPLPIPDVSLSGRVPPTNVVVKLDTTNCSTDMMVWPHFHNGVAAGLRLAATKKIPRTWIIYNRPDPQNSNSNTNNTRQNPQHNANTANSAANASSSSPPNHAHGGMLMALGLQGHLSSLAMTDIYEYLTQNIDTTTVGVLIGMAASKRGTCDPSISKMLCLHVPSLLPTPFTDMERSSSIQSAALAGIGFLYQGSAHRLMTEFLLGEMGRRPSSDKCTDRESYALSTGLALGLVTLARGKGRDGAAGLADLRIEERLVRYMVGGKDPERAEKELMERAAASASGEQVKCSRIYEGGYINTDVTAPGATLALGLMYIQSGNKSVAARLNLPETQFLLDYVRSDFLLLRVISKSLILWDDVKPTTSWVDSQFPRFILESYHKLGANLHPHFSLSAMASININSETNTNRTKNGPPPSATSTITIDNDHQDFTTQCPPSQLPVPDPQIIRQAYVHITSGACFSLGLRYAGTGNTTAASTITTRILELQRLRDENDARTITCRPERPILEMCLSCCAIGLGLVMAGTGDLDAIRLIRELRWRCDATVKYGSHMAFGAAIGLLLLGGGACTLGREPEDIGALVMAFFPRFPISSEDNQYHLQALRHLYVLAVKHNEIEAIDVDTKQPIYLPIKVRHGINNVVSMTAPCVLRNVETITSIDVVSERYHPLSIKLNNNSGNKNKINNSCPKVIYVKKKLGHLIYAHDPNATFLSIESYEKLMPQQSAQKLTSIVSEDPTMQEFAKYFCKFNGGHDNDLGPATFSGYCSLFAMGSTLEHYCCEKLFECMHANKTDALHLYVAIRFALQRLTSDQCVRSMWDIKLIVSYYLHSCRHNFDLGHELISLECIEIVRENVEQFFSCNSNHDVLKKELQNVWNL